MGVPDKEYINEGRVTKQFKRLDSLSQAEVIMVVNPDGSYISGGGSSTGSTSTEIQTLYTVTTAFAGASVGDVIANTEIIDKSDGSVTSSIWTNITTNLGLVAAPLATNISQQASNPLTNAQLRASPILSKLTDGTNNVGVLVAGGGNYNGLVVSLGAGVFLNSAGNNTTAQLAAGATFTGAVETVFNQPSIQINMVADQPVILTVNQYIDAAGLKRSGSFTYPIQAGAGFDMCLPMAGNYFNITVKNNGAAATTTFTLDTTYGTMPPVDTYGGQTVTMNQLAYGVANAVSVGGASNIQVTPTVTAASAYATGNVVGGVMTFASPFQGTVLTGVLESILVNIKSTQANITGLALALFRATPTGTFTDKVAPAIATADVVNHLGTFNLNQQTVSLGSNIQTWQLDGVAKELAGTTNNLYGVLIVTGAPTFPTTSDVVVTLGIMKD